MRRPLFFTLVALLPALGQSPARGQEAKDLPKAETVLDQFIEATGGKAAYEKFKNRSTSGTVEIPGANLKGKIKIFQAAPNQISVVTELGPAGKSTQATDGKSVWEISPITGERLLDGDEKAELLRKATFNEEIHTKELYAKVECTGIEDIDGKPAYKLVLTAKNGKTETEYYDKATHLMVKEMTTTKGPMGEFTVESFPSDYKKVDGVLMPFTATQKMLNQEIVIKIEEIKHNIDIPAETFKLPASLDDAAKKKAD
jgi:outer membrane lipoprotein-sorting protein